MKDYLEVLLAVYDESRRFIIWYVYVEVSVILLLVDRKKFVGRWNWKMEGIFRLNCI